MIAVEYEYEGWPAPQQMDPVTAAGDPDEWKTPPTEIDYPPPVPVDWFVEGDGFVTVWPTGRMPRQRLAHGAVPVMEIERR